jgi:hypothetical protein
MGWGGQLSTLAVFLLPLPHLSRFLLLPLVLTFSLSFFLSSKQKKTLQIPPIEIEKNEIRGNSRLNKRKTETNQMSKTNTNKRKTNNPK